MASLPDQSLEQSEPNDCGRWACPTCTFLNHPALENCECCESPRALCQQQVCESGSMMEEQPHDGDDRQRQLPDVTNQEDDSSANRELSYGYTAALVGDPERTVPMNCPTSSRKDVGRIARVGDDLPQYSPLCQDMYISKDESAETPEALEMVNLANRNGRDRKAILIRDNKGNVTVFDYPTKGGESFLPVLSPEEIALSEERTVSVRVTPDVLDTSLDDATPKVEIGSTRRPSFELAACSTVDWVEAGGVRGDPTHSFASRTVRQLKESSKRLIIVAFFVILAVIVFLGVFPPSFVYLDYGHVALKQTKSTGYVNRKDVVYPGCHVLGPDIELKIFNSSALTLDFASVSSFLRDQMEVSFDCNLQYFIRQESVGQLHEMFDMDFEPVIKKIAFSALKASTTKYTLENIRLNRSYVEKTLHKDLQQKLGGDCCPNCCDDTCQKHPTCMSGCNSERSSCYPGYHVDVQYFNFGGIVLPSQVTSRLLTTALLYVKADTEHFKQEHALEEKETKRQVARVMNEAAEIKNRADVKAEYIMKIANAKAYAVKSRVDMNGLLSMCSVLGITDAEQKLSVYMLKTFNKMDVSLAPGWKNASTYTNQGQG